MDYRVILDKGSYLTLPKPLIKTIGIKQTTILMELITYENYLINKDTIKIGEPFFIGHDKLNEEFGFSHSIISTILKDLKKLNLISIIKRGLPARNYYQINENEVSDLLDKCFSKELVVLKQDNKSCENNTTSDVKTTPLFNKRNINKRNINNSFSKEKQMDFTSPISTNKNNTSLFDKNNNSIPLKKPNTLNTIEYKLIEKYNNRLDSNMRLITKERNYRQSKTIKECINKIKSLMNGTFLSDYPIQNLDTKVINKLNHPLILNELETLLEESLEKYDLIHKGNYFPENKDTLKKNLNDFLYNSHTESGWFTYCLNDIKSNKEFCLGQLKSELNTNIITIYMSRFKYKLTENQEYNLLLNIKNTMDYYKSFLKKVENIYRWNPDYLNHFDNEISFATIHTEYLKRYKDQLSPGHVKLTGAVGDDFAKWCRKEYNVNIRPSIDDLLEIEETNRLDDERNERLKRNAELQKKQEQSSRDKEEFESLMASGDIDFFEDFDDEEDDFKDF